MIAYLKDKLLGLPSEADPDIERQKSQIQIYIEKLALFSRAYRERSQQYRSLMSIQKGRRPYDVQEHARPGCRIREEQ